MTEVIPGIYQMKLPLPRRETPLGYVNAYLIRGDNGFLAVDTGLNTEEAFGALKKQLAEIGAGVENIAQIVVTHIHPDHYGLVGRLKQLSKARFYLHQMEKDMIDSRYIHLDDLLVRLGQWLNTNGVPPLELPEMQNSSVRLAKFVAYVLPDVTLHGAELISTGVFNFRVLWTPGHSPGHICLYEPDRKLLLSGDHVLPTITPNIGLHPQSSRNPLGDFISSLSAVKGLDVDMVLPGHEDPFTGLKARVEEIVQHHERRNAEIISAITAGPRTGYQIAEKVTWSGDTDGNGWKGLSPRDKRLAVLETLAHLESMKTDGRIGKFSKNGLIYYSTNEKTGGGNK